MLKMKFWLTFSLLISAGHVFWPTQAYVLSDITQIEKSRYSEGGKFLSLCAMDLEEISPRVFEQIAEQWPCLAHINITRNRLKELPDSIGLLKNLTDVELFDNQLEHLPYTFGMLKKLRKLRLANTKITTLPEQLEKLEDLELLSIPQTMVCTIPYFVTKLQNLKLLVVNRDAEISPEILDNLYSRDVLIFRDGIY